MHYAGGLYSYNQRVNYSHSIVDGGLDEMS